MIALDKQEMSDKPLAAFFAPSVQIAQQARQMARQLELELNLEVFDYFSESLLEHIKERNYQLLIASGACANILRANFDFTVLELLPDLSSFFADIEELINAGACKIAVLASPGHVAAFNKFDFAQAQLSFYPVYDMSQVPSLIGDIMLNGHDGIVSGQMVNEYLLTHYPKFKARVFSCSDHALKNTLLAAKRILHLEKVKRLHLTRLDLLINNIQEGVLIFNKKHETVFFNVMAEKILHDYSPNNWYDTLEPLFESTLNKHAVVSLGNRQVLMHTMHFVFAHTDIDNHVVLFQEASAIEAYEHTIRRHNIAKGLIAKATFSSMIATDHNMQQLVAKAKLFARTDSTVLVYGQTGTGKEVLAQSIHNHSSRKSEPFVSLNCASLPPSLIESELFGYAEGAFTGARKHGKKGLFELANKGTIFLDEIGELSLDVQSRLLRVLQEREVMRVGDDKIIPLDVRVICATNRDLLTMAAQGTFRLDLYYRINVLQLRIPSLKERPSDIGQLFNSYTKTFLGKGKGSELTIDEEAQHLLLAYPWPGNIRQLRNVAEAVVLYGPHITLERLCDVMCLNYQATQAYLAQHQPQQPSQQAEPPLPLQAQGLVQPLGQHDSAYAPNWSEPLNGFANAPAPYQPWTSGAAGAAGTTGAAPIFQDGAGMTTDSSHGAPLSHDFIASAQQNLHNIFTATEQPSPASPSAAMSSYNWPPQPYQGPAAGAASASPTASTASAAFAHPASPANQEQGSSAAYEASSEGAAQATGQTNKLHLELDLPSDFKLKDLERIALNALLKNTTQQELCERLNISRVTLWRKLKDPTS